MPDLGPDPFPRASSELERHAYAHPARPARQPRRNIWPWLIAGLLASFTIGILGSPWIEAEVRSQLPEAVQPAATAHRAELQALEARIARLESRPAPKAGAAAPAERIAALEAATAARQSADSQLSTQLQALATDLDRVSDQATAGDERIRDLFLLTVMRRMVEAGRPLTQIEDTVSARFRPRDSAAVEALAAWSREPQTRRTLAARLPELGEAGAQADEQAAGGWWERLKASLSSLITVQKPAGEQAPGSLEVVRAAYAALREDDLERAISEMASGPQSAATGQWVRDARLLLGAEVALDRLDSLALAATIPAVEPAPPPVAAVTPPPTQAPLNAN